jgi:hypothetical protein
MRPCLENAETFGRAHVIRILMVLCGRNSPMNTRTMPTFTRIVDFRILALSGLPIETPLTTPPPPHVAHSPAFWTAVINSDLQHGFHGQTLGRLIFGLAPPAIHMDRELMLLACLKDANVYSRLDVDLKKNDEGILRAVIEQHHSQAFFLIPKPVQRLYPHLVVQALPKTPGPADIPLGRVAEDLWSNLEVMKAYVLANRIMGQILPPPYLPQ